VRRISPARSAYLLATEVAICEEYFELVQAWLEAADDELRKDGNRTPMVEHFAFLVERHYRTTRALARALEKVSGGKVPVARLPAPKRRRGGTP
jgi:hypothetical protein